MRFCVYQLRASDEDQPFYIGKTFEGSKRLVEHRYSSRVQGRMVCTKIRSVEARNAVVLHEILQWFDSELESLAAEVSLIAQHGRKDNGTGILCNHTDGGEGTVGKIHSVSTRAKMSKAKKGNKINVGRKRPDFASMWEKPITVFLNTGERVGSFASSKDAIAVTGIKKAALSDCLVEKMKTAMNKETGIVYQFKRGIIDNDIGAVKHRQHDGLGQIQQITKDGELVAEYRNSKDAQERTGVDGSSIRRCIHKTAKTAGGFVWRLAEPLQG